MSKSDSREEVADSPALPRLPPGRHGLSREFVTKNQRDRLAAGIIASVAEKGYHEMTIADISTAAGVSRRTFYTYFKSKEEAYFDTFELIADYLRETTREAAAGEGEWTDQVAARIGTILAVFAANPDLARFVLIAPRRAGGKLVERYNKALEEAGEELAEGVPADATVPSPVVQQSLISGVMGLLSAQVEEGGGDELAKLLPDLLELFLAPFIGAGAAAKAAKKSR